MSRDWAFVEEQVALYAAAQSLQPSALESGAKLICCDVSEEWTSIARSYWERAGVADRIDLRIGPARDTLRALPDAACTAG